MIRISLLLSALLATSPALAQDGDTEPDLLGLYAGESSIFVNDALGDGHDRWRSASWSKSWFWDRSFHDKTLELRFRSEIISPWTPAHQGPANDRIYANAIGLGGILHDRSDRLTYSLGGEILVTGDQTGLARLQEGVHDLFNLSASYNPGTRNDRHLGDSIHGKAMGEAGYDFGTGNWRLHPYLAATAGYETTAMVGIDYWWGEMSGAEHVARDTVTGMPVPTDGDAIWHAGDPSVSFVAGVDATRVFDSIYLPDDGDVTAEDIRLRARAGLVARVYGATIFAGQAWLSEEFTSQAEAQRTGLLSVDFRF